MLNGVQYQFIDKKTGGLLQMTMGTPGLSKHLQARGPERQFYTIAWNQGRDQPVEIDGIPYVFPGGSLLPLMMNQPYRFSDTNDIVSFRFNREFYCVVDHDQEVSCVGFIFYGPAPVMFIQLDKTETEQMIRLKDMFVEEFVGEEDIKADMLRMLLVRLIIKLTRLAKKQRLPEAVSSQSYDLMREYCLLVERHYKTQKQVSFYAGELHKSPKTLANLFARNGQPSPLQVIHERLLLEAQRQMAYTRKSIKEIAFDLGFDDAGHFGKFVKSMTGKTPGELRLKGISGG